MERRTELNIAHKIMGKNFIGPEQLESIKSQIGILSPLKMTLPIPKIHFSPETLKNNKENYILILGIPFTAKGEKLTINKMRSFFGSNPTLKEPCFYNQDWYLKENFANNSTLKFQWYFIRKEVYETERGKQFNQISMLNKNYKLPSSILVCYTFFVYFILNSKKILWGNDYLWCEDKDHNGDQVYIGRYLDPSGINKNGLNIHRYLTLRNNYSFVDEIQ